MAVCVLAPADEIQDDNLHDMTAAVKDAARRLSDTLGYSCTKKLEPAGWREWYRQTKIDRQTLQEMRDLRDWLRVIDDLGELQVVDGADWNLEIGGISELNYRRKPSAALLFDRHQGLPAPATAC